jgi:hypothetical protein
MQCRNFILGVHSLPGPALEPEQFLPICIASSGMPISRFVAIPDQPLTRRPSNRVTGLSIAAIDVNAASPAVKRPRSLTPLTLLTMKHPERGLIQCRLRSIG